MDPSTYGAVNYENLIKRRKSGKIYKSPLSPSHKNYVQKIADKSHLDVSRASQYSPESSP